MHVELRLLVGEKWLTKLSQNKYELSPKAVSLLQQVESFFKIQKKKNKQSHLR